MFNTPVHLALVFFPVALLGGCKVATIHSFGPQTNFDYPNSNVVRIGPAAATVKTGFPVTGADWQRVFDEAVASVPEADIVVDYQYDMEIYSFLWFNWTEVEITGTAASMETGEQPLR